MYNSWLDVYARPMVTVLEYVTTYANLKRLIFSIKPEKIFIPCKIIMIIHSAMKLSLVDSDFFNGQLQTRLNNYCLQQKIFTFCKIL